MQTLPFAFLADPRTRLRRLLTGTIALITSAALHTAMPFLDLGRAVEAKSRISLEIVAPPIPLPAAEDAKEGPLADPEPPPSPAERAAAQIPPESEPLPEEEPAPEPPLDEPPAEALAEKADLDEPAAAPAPTSADAVVKKSYADIIADRVAMRRQRIAALRKAAEERRQARLAAAKKGRGEGGAAAPAGGVKTGDPDAVYLCEADALGREVRVDVERPLTSWVTVVPTALVGFDTRPGIGEYLEGTSQIVKRARTPRGRLGVVEFALPAEVLQFELDSPRGVRVALGRGEGRCLVGMRYTAQLFPITLKRVPMRLVDGSNRTVDALVDIQFYKDASFDVTAIDGTELPFTKGKIKNSRAIATNIEDHYQAARLAKAVAGFFGIDLRKAAASAAAQKASEEKTRRSAERLRRMARGDSSAR